MTPTASLGAQLPGKQTFKAVSYWQGTPRHFISRTYQIIHVLSLTSHSSTNWLCSNSVFCFPFSSVSRKCYGFSPYVASYPPPFDSQSKIKTSPFRRVYRQNAAAFFATEPTFSAAESPVVSEDEGRRVGECISQQTAPSSTGRLPVFITQYQLSVWLRKLLRSLPRYVTHVVLRTHRGHMTKHMGCLFSL